MYNCYGVFWGSKSLCLSALKHVTISPLISYYYLKACFAMKNHSESKEYHKSKIKAVLLHAMEALGGRGA
jgi:hypothetical protein